MNVQFKEVASFINGYPFKPSDWSDTGLPIIRIQDLTGTTDKPNHYEGQYPKKIEVNDGDILISWSASLGVYRWNKGKALLNQHIFKVDFNKKPIDRGYFVWAVEYKLTEMKYKTHGSTMKHIVKGDFDAITIPYPSISDQANIALQLDNIKRLITAKEKELSNLDCLVKSRFIEMFGDVFTNDKGYKTCAFGEYVIQMNIGPFGSAMKNDVFVPKNKGYCMVYEQKHAIDKDMNVSARYVDEATYKVLKRFEVGPGDIIVSCRGTIGECFLIPEGSPNGIIHPSLMMIKPKSEVNHKFLVFLLERILAEQTQDGSGVKMAIKAKDLSKIQTIHPSRELQDSFISFVELVDKSRFVCHSRNFL